MPPKLWHFTGRWSNPKRYRVALRLTYRGNKLRKDFSNLNGKEVQLRTVHGNSISKYYPGEQKLVPYGEDTGKLFADNDLSWIASGDVKLIEDQ